MIINFTEIPKANEGGLHQDHFELFSRDFLKTIGYTIIRHPDRGADGKKDLIVSETKTGIGGDETTIKWLVSCKHYAHSGKSVTDKDEPDILDRVIAHNCQGFIGVYSTIASSSLSNKLFGYNDKIKHIIFECARIEEMILSKEQNEQLLLRYFPLSYEKYKQQINKKDSLIENDTKNIISTSLNEDTLLRVNLTAIIIIEVEKIKEKYWEADWNKRNEIIEELNKFKDHLNPYLNKIVFRFLSDIASMTRANMPYNSACSIYLNVLTFFPGLHNDENNKENIQIAKKCIQIGHDIVYDSLIHLRNLSIAMWGLTIIKFIYRLAKGNNITELTEIVYQTYNDLESTIRRPERDDLGDAQEMMKIFREDLDEWDLAFPILTPHLMKRINIEKNK